MFLVRRATCVALVLEGCASSSRNTFSSRPAHGHKHHTSAWRAACAGVTNKHNRRRLVHTGCWPAQLALWLVLIGACFAMPNSVFSAVGQAFKVFAGLFLVRFPPPAEPV